VPRQRAVAGERPGRPERTRLIGAGLSGRQTVRLKLAGAREIDCSAPGRFGPGVQHHHRVRPLAVSVVGYSDDRAARHGGVAGQRVLHLGRVHVATVDHDHVLEPVDQVEVAGLVEVAGVAGVQPPAAQRLGGLRGPVPVPAHQPAAQHDLTHGARRKRSVRPVHDLDLDMRHRASRRTQPGALDVVGWRQERTCGGRLGGRVHLLERRPGQRGHGAGQRLADRRGP